MSEAHSSNVEKSAIKGNLDLISGQSGWYSFTGWAIDSNASVPVSTILVFVNGSQVYSGKPTLPRPDVAKALNAEAALNSGFRFSVPKSAFPGADADVRMIAVSSTGQVGELTIDNSMQRTLADAH